MIRNVIQEFENKIQGTPIKTFKFSYYEDMLNTINRNVLGCDDLPCFFVSPPLETKRYELGQTGGNTKQIRYTFETYFIFNESIQTHNLPTGKRYDDLSLIVKYEMIILDYFTRLKESKILEVKNLKLDYALNRSANGNFIVEASFEIISFYSCTEQELKEICYTG